ncbi:MAG: Asp-tRNA(Asn)/Glu-tRNA(Gln) amidotransferase subunit GatB [Candidatus Levybacteria bacterium]|nr:Asp-tRNA(Asn)/Glu-tRNA(Gln) amidotransferase subunit GatB [Candidatus Levybacteria bacterium]
MNKYKSVIGLEVHVELKTASKMFCRCDATYFGKEPNTHTCPVCLGLPGALPVPNKKAIEWCIMIALALNCKINTLSKFDRKNYFYPDLPKGYQISQYDMPFGVNGWMDIKSEIRNPKSETNSNFQNSKRIRIRRVHMEEDTGKLIHQKIEDKNVTLIDFNRSGIPLVEIVTEPDFNSPQEVTEYLQKLQQIVRYLDVSNANMERGEMRLEPNISLKGHPGVPHSGTIGSQKQGDSIASLQNDTDLPNYKVEVKNINSFKFVEKAIRYEIERQEKILDSEKLPAQETRGWDEDKAITFSQRAKEEANDYRYFPEPDIPPIKISESQISNLKSQIIELPDIKIERFSTQYGLSNYDSGILTREKHIANYFEDAVKIGAEHSVTPKQIANAIINKKTDTTTVLPATLVKQIVSTSQIAAIDDEEMKKIVVKIIEENKKAVEEYKNGKTNVMMFLIGQVMKKIKKKVDIQKVKTLIENQLKRDKI